MACVSKRSVLIKRLPPLNSLKSFEAAARLGSFQKAAQELYVTPSAVSHQVKSLEAFLELELFIRHTRRIELTSAGREYMETVQQALEDIGYATRKLIATHGSGELNLAVAPAFLTRWLLPRMSRFYDQHPNIELEISASTGLIDFAHSDTDMAVYFGSGDWPDVTAHFLKSSALIPVCSPDLLEEHPIETPEDITNHLMLHVSKRPDEWSAWFETAGVPYREKRKGLHLSSSLLTTRAAAKGLGVALADVTLISDEIQTGQLVAPLDIRMERAQSFYLVYDSDRNPTETMAQFKEWIMAEMAVDALTSAREEKENRDEALRES